MAAAASELKKGNGHGNLGCDLLTSTLVNQRMANISLCGGRPKECIFFCKLSEAKRSTFRA